ncbi:uncharacterized protein F4822DRAFT_278409 [Hypoxylon trugodes]|uniref:uncharacterized protein n=1 Tax=Hypoxylon trugodes TaxID=326681 RepID=UPI00219C40A0|nr:uncharacterized protein F4822DRAFT_278409 [Hypoxylon trugodes]KAI1387282.1 hypothetical protein F4822DRAFT_278409 [Hypoxylon trugodes]
MAPRRSPNSAKEHLLPLSPAPTDPWGRPGNTLKNHTNQHPTNSSHRFWRRTLILIIFPLAITAYYFFIWLYFKRDKDDPVKYGSPSEIWIFYSWFVLSVFALEWFRYGLVGAEAAMLQTPFWRVPDAAALLTHSEAAWSGPDGWFKLRVMHRLWYFLAALSFLAFVAIPLSGLSFETSDGYIPLSIPPIVIGHTLENYHSRQESFYYSGALKGWEIGSPTMVPGYGIIYTPEYLQREQYSGLKSVPNTLPLDEGIPEILLTPQADTPIAGKVWGLHAGYNCSMVKDASEFTILNQKSSSTYSTNRKATSDQLEWVRLETPSNEMIYAFTSSSDLIHVNNIWGYAEMGVSSNSSVPTYDGSEPSSFDQDGIAKADVLEYALWQARLKGSYGDNYSNFNDTLDPAITGMGLPIMQASNGTFMPNSSFFKMQSEKIYGDHYNVTINDYLYKQILSLAPPIGVRCRVVSTLGTAELNPVRSSFHSFQQTPSPHFNSSAEDTPTPRMGYIASQTLLGHYWEIFTAANAPAPVTDSNSYLYQNYIQPRMLQKSIMLAHAMDALQLMYDGTYGFEGAWRNDNLTASTPGKVLVAGIVPQSALAVVFGVWALSCTLLGLVYGFRRRWSDSLDGYSFFRFGVEYADEVKGKQDFWDASEFYYNQTLRSLRIFVGQRE